MQFTPKDFGYTVYSRLEEAARHWLEDKLLTCYADRWRDQIPKGVWENAKLIAPDVAEAAEPSDLLDYSYLSDLAEIVCHQNAYTVFFPAEELKQEDFQELFQQLNTLRAKVAHVRRSFTHDDLEDLIKVAQSLSSILGHHADPVVDTLAAFRNDPIPKAIRLPPQFVVQADTPIYTHLNNLPPADYEMEGGFVGRKEDLKTLRKYLTGNLYRVVTISGAGGVGKTALAHRLCDSLLCLPTSRFMFDGVVWISAKEEKLTLMGIDKLTPDLKAYEDLVDTVLEMFGVDTDVPFSAKETPFHTLLNMCNKGFLFAVDNLETIQDEKVISFIKELPPPHRVLITSRLGLGEIEKRYPLKSLPERDAITLFRSVAREKGLHDLASQPDDVLRPYIKSMAFYPLIIKWVLGQVSLGVALETVVASVTSPGSDVTTFCFNKIFQEFLNDEDRLTLYALSTDERPMPKAVLCHLCNFPPETMDIILQKLTVASLVVNTAVTTSRNEIQTQYELLSLTRRFVSANLQSQPEIHRLLRTRAAMVQHMLTEGRRAGRLPILVEGLWRSNGRRTHSSNLGSVSAPAVHRGGLR